MLSLNLEPSVIARLYVAAGDLSIDQERIARAAVSVVQRSGAANVPFHPEKQPGNSTDELLIPLLQEIQERHGYLPREVLEQASRETGIPLSRMFGVITFYTHFRLEPGGSHTVRSCQGTACHVRGARRVADTIREHLGVSEGETTADRKFTYETVQCLGTCFLAPVIMVDDDYHGEMTARSIRKLLDGHE